jgi:hypothetical protein
VHSAAKSNRLEEDREVLCRASPYQATACTSPPPRSSPTALTTSSRSEPFDTPQQPSRCRQSRLTLHLSDYTQLARTSTHWFDRHTLSRSSPRSNKPLLAMQRLSRVLPERGCYRAFSHPCSHFPACHARRVPLDQGGNLSARQGSPQDPPRHPPTSHSQPRHLDKTAKPIVSRYIPCLHGLAMVKVPPKGTLCP